MSTFLRTELKDGKLFNVSSAYHSAEPKLVINYWETEGPPYPEFSGKEVQCLGGAYFIWFNFKQIPVNNLRKYPDLTEIIDVPKPKSKNWVWKDGYWQKEKK